MWEGILADKENSAGEFDLQPDPRVLVMLGEINLDPWRCVAELVDNSIDGFLSEDRAGRSVADPEVTVVVPTQNVPSARLEVRDNGPGMTVDVLETAVRAGWTSNNPIDSLGLFGMGFNIATARLGTKTEVWTTREGESVWHGLEIDFETLQQQRHFRTPRLIKEKADSSQHGTQIVITQLKEQQKDWLAKSHNRSSLRRNLAQAYSSMLRSNGEPISFALTLNGTRISAWQHCTWDEERAVDTASHGTVPAVISFSYPLPERMFCNHCMQWRPDDAGCANCPRPVDISPRQRIIHGWVGLQRYQDTKEYGFDFIRNGRKIEIGNKDLFTWTDEDGDQIEYPVDDQRHRGRFVGEIHVDHCRVSYAKDRFDRTDPSWLEMRNLVRGNGPIRPQIARQAGYGENNSPLSKLFAAFRRNQPSKGSSWSRIICVQDNDRAKSMAKGFRDGEPNLQTDELWWKLVEEQDDKDIKTKSTGADGEGSNVPGGLLDDDQSTDGSGQTSTGEASAEDGGQDGAEPGPGDIDRRQVFSLSQTYSLLLTAQKINVVAYEAVANDPMLAAEKPWNLKLSDNATGTYEFVFDVSHTAFGSATLTPLDALLAEIAHLWADYWALTQTPHAFASILAELRETYAGEASLDPIAVAEEAQQLLSGLALAIAGNCPEEDRGSLYDDLPASLQKEVMEGLAANSVTNISRVLGDGAFLQHSPPSVSRHVVASKPNLVMDGEFWDFPYEQLDYLDTSLTEKVRAEALALLLNRLDDLIWVAGRDSSHSISPSREELLRARMSIQLLVPARDPVE